MRKMTKTAVTLAAMSAMTVAAASMAFAAEDRPNISSITDEKEVVDSSASGHWIDDGAKGWKFTLEDGTKLKDQWAEIDGVWYYFKGEYIYQNRFAVLNDKGYFFDENGRLATGWQKITSKMDAYSDITIADALYNPQLNVYTPVDEYHEYDYHDYVWCYFDEHGVAKENEWFKDTTGLWYYFDGNAMVKNIYDYIVEPDNYDAADSMKTKRYGFDENGAMLVGWNYKKVEKDWNNPTADDAGKVWYYYKPNGEMQQKGWMLLDGKWYLFANLNADGQENGDGIGTQDVNWGVGGYPLIVNSYVASYPNNSATTPEYFYVNNKGELVSGVTKIKNAYKVVFYPQGNKENVQVAYEVVKTPKDSEIAINFADKTYAAKEDIVGNRYYTMGYDKIVKAPFGSKENTIRSINNTLYDATDLFKNNEIVGTGAWRFTDMGQVRINDEGSDKKNAITYVPLKWHSTSKENPTVVTNNGTQIAIPDTVDNRAAIANAEVAKADYCEAVSDFNEAWRVYNTFITTKTVTPSGVSGSAAADALNKPLTIAQVEAEVAKAKVENDQAEDQVALYEKLVADGKDTVAITDYKNKLEAAKTAATSAAEKLALAEMAEKEIRETVATAAVTQQQAYTAAERVLESYEAKLNDAQRAVEIKSNYYVDENGNTSTAISNGRNVNDFIVVGELVKSAFIGRKADLYLANGDGDFVVNKAVLINDDADITYAGTVYDNAYLVFDNAGKAVKGYAGTKKSITIGGVTYWATGESVTYEKATAEIFVANKTVNGKR